MTDRVKGFTVVLSKDIRIDDVEPIREALKMVKGVMEVSDIIAEGMEDEVIRMRTKNELREKFYNFIRTEL